MDNIENSLIRQVFHNTTAIIERARIFYFPQNWVTVFTGAYLNAVRDLTRNERVVLDALMHCMRTHNIARVSRDELASLCRLSPTSVSKAITTLRHKGLIYKNHDGVFEIDPEIAWWGRRQAWFEHTSEPNERHHERVDIYSGSEHVTTLWYPRVRASADNPRRARTSR